MHSPGRLDRVTTTMSHILYEQILLALAQLKTADWMTFRMLTQDSVTKGL